MQPETSIARTDDIALMQQVAARDAKALETLYDRYSHTLLALSMRVLHRRDQAEDVLINVFWEVWNRAERYDPARGAPLTYLMTLTRCRAIDRHRRVGTMAIASLDSQEYPTESLQAQADNPLNQAASAEQRVRIQAAISQLSDVQRNAIELSFFEGLSHSEIAEKTQLPLGTVKSHIRLGLIHLRDSLRSENEDEAAKDVS